MKVTVFYLLDGLVQQEEHEGERKQISLHIHDDPGPYKRGYVRVAGVEHLYASVVKMIRADVQDLCDGGERCPHGWHDPA